jgi:CheY-like chemotaxis protein
VDDDTDYREILVHMLEQQGAIVIAVDSADRALSLVQHLGPDVLLSDFQMADKDGLWLIQAVQALGPERGGMIPAVCITAHVDAEPP